MIVAIFVSFEGKQGKVHMPYMWGSSSSQYW
jgi:hypothetical protein